MTPRTLGRTAGTALAATALLLTAAGCGSDEPSAGSSPAAAAQAGEAAADETSAADGTAADAAQDEVAQRILAAHDLAGMTGREIVDHLDRLGGDDRPADLMASVRPDGLVLTQGEEEATVPMPEDEFYVSVAPYAERTHDCFFHSLTTCQGELAGEEVEVTITTDDGEVLLDETRTTFANGFVGFWLPRDVQGTIAVTHEGRTGQVPFATGADDATCLTTLKVT